MMAALIVAILAVAAFAGVLAVSRLDRTARQLSERARAGISAMLDPEMDDEATEIAVQRAGLGVLRATGGLFLRFAGSLGAAAAVLYGADLLGLVSVQTTFDLMLGWPFLLGTTLFAVAAYVLARRGRSGSAAAASSYSASDQLIHKIAFASPAVQRNAARLEDRLYGRRIAPIAAKPPVFVTGLPRAGTTAVLNTLAELPWVATHLYRDMPFVMAPILYNRLSAPFARSTDLQERAHGDGLKIGLDSPEAFEDVIWRSFWPEHYRDATIPLWTAEDARPEATAFFEDHFRKVRHVRNRPQGLYVSKNNGNIARLALLPEMFPGCRIVTPVRAPAGHAASLWRQHRNFLTRHAEDPFSADYMRDIGHLEFGQLHRPIAFDGFAPETTPEDPNYWLDYWIAAHREILHHRDRIIMVDQANMGPGLDRVVADLAEDLEIEPGPLSVAPRPDKSYGEALDFDPALLAEAERIRAEFLAPSASRG